MEKRTLKVSLDEILQVLHLGKEASPRPGIIELPLPGSFFVGGKCESIFYGKDGSEKARETFNQVFFRKNLSICTLGVPDDEAQ